MQKHEDQSGSGVESISTARQPSTSTLPPGVLLALGRYGDSLRNFVSEAHVAAAYQCVIEAIKLHTRQQDSRPAQSQASIDVLAERRRQIEAEGWTPEHDDEHGRGEMAVAAGYYALACGWPHERDIGIGVQPSYWPWDRSWWKPKDARSNLIRAGALILAEIERLDRAALSAQSDSERPCHWCHSTDASVALYPADSELQQWICAECEDLVEQRAQGYTTGNGSHE